MNFKYEAHIGIDPISGEPQYVLRPEILITIRGPKGSQEYLALVDTGADHTVIPTNVAADLGIALSPTRGARPVAFGGQKLDTTYGDVEFELRDDQECHRWATTVLFHDSDQEMIVLGHVGFLHYFRAGFDGFAMELTLTPTEDFPHQPPGVAANT